MPTNLGTLKEDEMVLHLHNKRFKDLSNNLKNLVTALFGLVNPKSKITAKKVEGFLKPDFFIEIEGQKKYVSMKTGRSTSLHQETIKNFVLFLRSLGISTRTQQTILLYHYGDGTLDGSASKRYEYEQLRLMLKDRIKEANAELNKSKDFIMKVVHHCIYYGTLENAIEIDALYCGNYEYGIVATKKQINRYFATRNWDWLDNLHIGPMQLRPHARYIGKEIKNPKKRELVEVYWANLSADIDYLAHRFDY